MIYLIEAYWPNAVMDPARHRVAHLADAIEQALALMQSHEHTTITVRTPDGLELVKLWGQPPLEGEWP